MKALIFLTTISLFLKAEFNEIYVAHEWDTLRVVLIGGMRKSTLHIKEAREMQDEADNVERILREHGVEIYRANDYVQDEDLKKGISKKEHLNPFPLLFARDPPIVIGNNVIECSMKAKHRTFEKYAIRKHFLPLFFEKKALYLPMPPYTNIKKHWSCPDLCLIQAGNILINGNEIYVGSPKAFPNHKNKNRLKKLCHYLKIILSKEKVSKMLQQIDEAYVQDGSSTGAIKWLNQFFGKTHKIYEIKIEAPFYLDLDQCLSLVRPGLAVICKEVIKSELPESIRGWDFIEISKEEADMQGANLLILNKNKVLIDNRNKRIANELRNRGIEVIEVKFSAIGKLKGGLRCFHHPFLRRD